MRHADITALTSESVAAAVKDVLSVWPIERAWLFGSIARGQQTPTSDVDISVLPMEGAHIGLGVSQLEWDLEDALLCDVDVIVEPISELRHPAFYARYHQERVLIYEREKL